VSLVRRLWVSAATGQRVAASTSRKAGGPSRVSDWRCLVIENWQAVIRHAGLDLVAENARLRRQNERLRTEREILKKRCAFFRKRRDERRP